MNRYCRGFFLTATVVGVTGSCWGQSAQPPNTQLLGVGSDQLCVTNGAVLARDDGWLSIETASSRALVLGATQQIAEIRFRYLGPTERSKPLASGELRRQIGLKLKAQDTCNLLYAMWHIEPDSRLAVSIKRNPGMRTHAQCGAQGYVSAKADRTRTLAKPQRGEIHTFRANLRDNRLTLTVDGEVAWEGSVGVPELDGPVGLRTDNARFHLQYFTMVGDRVSQAMPIAKHCVPSPGD